MLQGHVRSQTVLIATGKRTRVYRDLDEVPAQLRNRLRQSTEGPHSAQILIADQEGQQRIRRMLQAFTKTTAKSEPEKPVRQGPDLRLILELIVLGAIGLSIWVLLMIR